MCFRVFLVYFNAEQVRCPALIIHGAKDPLVLRSHPERLHALIAGSELSVHPEGKHNVHLRFATEARRLL